MKAVVDDCGDIIGVGATVEEARDNAVNTILYDPRDYIISLVFDMTIRDITPALKESVDSEGGDTNYRVLEDGTLDIPWDGDE